MLRFLAQSGSEFSLPIQGIGLATVLAIIGLLWRIQRRDRRYQDKALRRCRLEAEVAQWRLDIVVGDCRRAGVDIRQEVWATPSWAVELFKELDER